MGLESLDKELAKLLIAASEGPRISFDTLLRTGRVCVIQHDGVTQIIFDGKSLSSWGFKENIDPETVLISIGITGWIMGTSKDFESWKKEIAAWPGILEPKQKADRGIYDTMRAETEKWAAFFGPVWIRICNEAIHIYATSVAGRKARRK